MHSRWTAATLALFSFGFGCAPEDKCPPATACGGDIVGATDNDGDGFADKTWTISGSCLNDIVAVPQNATLLNQSPSVDGQPPPEPEHNHWCSEMVLDAAKGVKKISPWFPAIPVRDGNIKYSANGRFELLINYFSPQTVEFQKGCFESQGYIVVPEGSASSTASFSCSEFGEALRFRLEQEPNIDNSTIACGSDDAGGCLCGYTLLMVTGANGTWTLQGKTVNHYDRTTQQPVSQADYCVENSGAGETLSLSGHNKNFLFNQPHLRSLAFGE